MMQMLFCDNGHFLLLYHLIILYPYILSEILKYITHYPKVQNYTHYNYYLSIISTICLLSVTICPISVLDCARYNYYSSIISIICLLSVTICPLSVLNYKRYDHYLSIIGTICSVSLKQKTSPAIDFNRMYRNLVKKD